MFGIGRKSLKGQLVTRFALVLGLMMVVVNVGFFVFLLIALPSTNTADIAVRPIIADAVRTSNGELVVEATHDLKIINRQYPAFWFVAVHPDGRRVDYGPVPWEYSSILPRLDGILSLDIRGEEGSPVTATIANITSQAGDLKVLYGGKSSPGSYVLNLLWGLKIIYIPFTLAPLFVVFLALPLMVGRALSGIRKTIHRAAAIDASSLGMRLPKDDVVDELHPLVAAFNSALARIDLDVTKRQRFFANSAHELRTPIAILQTRLEVLPVGPQRERLLLDVSRLAATAEQLLDMQRFETVQSWGDVDLVALCETVAADCAPLAIAEGYDLEFETEANTFVVNGDYGSLERAVTNLVRNAIEHGGGGGTIQIDVLRNGTIEVADEGPGISDAEKEKVFEPFYRTKPKSTGAGLGLSLVHQIAQNHKGHISIIRQEKGARFRLNVGR